VTQAKENGGVFEPRYPGLLATGVLSIWVFVLALPLWSGKFLGGAFSDQYHSGYAFRHWLAETWKRLGELPLWNPEMFGGMPFVGAMHGDIFYPTAWLRLVLPTGFAMGLGFVVHYVLAGVFVYWLLRLFKVSWAGAVTGGFAYQLSGVIGSYVQPGHDGKLFVTTLLPLALVGLVRGIRDERWDGYGIVALAVGLALLSPHAQMTYYLLIVAGLFALYLAFGERSARPLSQKAVALSAALAAVLVGFGIGMIQILPFFEYLPFSPRAEGYYGFEGSTSYAIPWAHVPEFLLSRFTGATPERTYWGPNPLKLHSEYLGAAALGLALFGAFDRSRRRAVCWLLGIGVLFLLVCLGGSTPFYRVWWTVMPFVKQTRAPGMALFVVVLIVAFLAGIGVDRFQRKEGVPWSVALMVAGGVIVLLGLVGLLGNMAEMVARGIERAQARPLADTAIRAGAAIRWGAVGSGVALVLVGASGWAMQREKLRPWVLALGFPLVVSADLWLNAKPFWTYSERPREGLYQLDEVTKALSERTEPYRVLNLSDTGLDVYPGASLMAFGISQLLGHHGNQLHNFNELLGGKNRWQYVFASRRLWELFVADVVLLPSGVDLSSQLPAYSFLDAEYDTLFAGVETSSGGAADVLVRRTAAPYAWVVPAALKLPDDQAIPNLADPRSPLGFDQLVLVDPDAPIEVEEVEALPDPLSARVEIEAWDVGSMELRVEPPVASRAYLVVSENYYPDWQATVDDEPSEVVRGNVTLLTVPLEPGAERVRLEFRSSGYETGRLITFVSLMLTVVVLAGPAVARRIRG
jgi:hypothetical protein